MPAPQTGSWGPATPACPGELGVCRCGGSAGGGGAGLPACLPARRPGPGAPPFASALALGACTHCPAASLPSCAFCPGPSPSSSASGPGSACFARAPPSSCNARAQPSCHAGSAVAMRPHKQADARRHDGLQAPWLVLPDYWMPLLPHFRPMALMWSLFYAASFALLLQPPQHIHGLLRRDPVRTMPCRHHSGSGGQRLLLPMP